MDTVFTAIMLTGGGGHRLRQPPDKATSLCLGILEKARVDLDRP
jgi:hypothetical protein